MELPEQERALVRPAKSVQHATAVLRGLATDVHGRRVSELSKSIGLDKSTVSRILQTLERERLATRDSFGRYRLGLGLVELAATALAALDFRDVARPFLAQLADASGETANLAVWEGGEAVVVENLPGHEPIQAMGRVGQRYPAHASALGKLLLSYQTKAEIDAVLGRGLAQYTALTITSPTHLEAELLEIRRTGYATNLGEYRADVSGLAAAVRDHTGGVIAGLGLAGPSYRLDAAAIEGLVGTVVRTARTISESLGLPAQPVPGRA